MEKHLAAIGSDYHLHRAVRGQNTFQLFQGTGRDKNIAMGRVVARQWGGSHSQTERVSRGKGQLFIAHLHQNTRKDRARLVFRGGNGDLSNHFPEQGGIDDNGSLTVLSIRNQGEFRGIHTLNIRANALAFDVGFIRIVRYVDVYRSLRQTIDKVREQFSGDRCCSLFMNLSIYPAINANLQVCR